MGRVEEDYDGGGGIVRGAGEGGVESQQKYSLLWTNNLIKYALISS